MVDVKTLDFSRAKPEEHHHRARYATVERRDRKCGQFGIKRTNSHQFGCNVHVTDHHPGATDTAMDDIGSDPRHRHSFASPPETRRGIGRPKQARS